MGKKNKPYSYAEVARHLGVSPQLLYDLRTGRREVSKRLAIRVARMTGLAVGELFEVGWDEFLSAVVRTMDSDV